MKKKSLIVAAALLIVLAAFSLSACGGNGTEGADAEGEKVVWKYAHTGRNGDELDQYAQLFKKYVEEEFENVTVELYPADQLGNEVQRMEQVEGGSCEFAQVYSLALATIVPEAQAFTINYALPFDNDELSYIFREGEAVKYVNSLVEEKGLQVMDWYPESFSCYTSNKKIGELKDFKGQNIRCMDNFVDIANVKGTGATPITLDYSEVYSGLQLGTIDGQQNPIPIIESNNFYEVQKYLVVSNHECVQDVVITNTEFYNSLSDEEKEKLKNVFDKLSKDALAQRTKLNEESLERIKEKGTIEIIELSEEDIEEWKAAISDSPREAFVKEVGESGQKVLDLLDGDIEAYSKK